MKMTLKPDVCVTCLSSDRQLTPLDETEALVHLLNYLQIKTSKGGVCWECWNVLMKFINFKHQVHNAQEALNTKLRHRIVSLSRLSTQLNSLYDYEYHYNDPLTIDLQIRNVGITQDLCDISDKQNDKNNDDHDIIDDVNDISNVDTDNHDAIGNCDDILNVGTDNHDTIDNDDDILNVGTDNHDTIDNDDDILNVGTDGHDDVDEDDRIPNIHIIVAKSASKCGTKNIKFSDAKIKKKLTALNNPKDYEGKYTEVIYTEDAMIKNREKKRNHPNFMKLPYKCDSCVLGFTSKEKYDFHLEKKHDERLGSGICDVCQIRFSNTTSLEKHKKTHYKSYKCTLCKHETSELQTMINHCVAKHSDDWPNLIHCRQCEVVVQTPEELERHVLTQHKLSCKECGVEFKGIDTLRRHTRRIHAVKREFVCEICTKTFKTKSRLESHMVNHNASVAKTLAYCGECRVQFKNINVYRSHLKHSANHCERTYLCIKCNKKFISKVYLNKHYNFYHLKKSKFHCEICDKMFMSDWLLKNHRQKHHGLSRSRDHNCNICGKKFFTIPTLRSHELTHSEQRSYMCEDCGDTFKQRPALYTHARLVHSGRGRQKKRDNILTTVR